MCAVSGFDFLSISQYVVDVCQASPRDAMMRMNVASQLHVMGLVVCLL